MSTQQTVREWAIEAQASFDPRFPVPTLEDLMARRARFLAEINAVDCRCAAFDASTGGALTAARDEMMARRSADAASALILPPPATFAAALHTAHA